MRKLFTMTMPGWAYMFPGGYIAGYGTGVPYGAIKGCWKNQ